MSARNPDKKIALSVAGRIHEDAADEVWQSGGRVRDK
jgi:hypothetical protein